MRTVTADDLKNLYIPPPDSHKGQNGKLLIIGGSKFFHAASLWALEVASRIVDLVHYSSVPENNALVMRIKAAFRDGIVVPRDTVERYIEEDDAILIGPGMMRAERAISNIKYQISNIRELEKIKDEGQQTAALTNYLLRKYPNKQWVIDAGALQMMEVASIPPHAILTPHRKEFAGLWAKRQETRDKRNDRIAEEEAVRLFVQDYHCVVLLKGVVDIVCDANGNCRKIEGGNAGMTKGGTGDVLAGLVAALACKNDPFTAATAGSYFNKRAGEALSGEAGPYFNASDLAHQIPRTMEDALRS